MTSIGPFDFIKSINSGHPMEMDKNYNKFLTNRAFSYHLDTALMANEINMFPNCDDQMHYDFMMRVIQPGKRYAKWHKPAGHGNAALLSAYYQIPMHQAYLYAPLFSEEQIKEISELVNTSKEK